MLKKTSFDKKRFMIFSILLSLLILTGSSNVEITNGINYQIITPQCTVDTIPDLITIAEEDIDTADICWKDKNLTVILKNGAIYKYPQTAWERNDRLNEKLKNATVVGTRMFTKAQNPPAFPGGDAAFYKYLTEYLAKQNVDVKNEKIGTGSIQFQVDHHGHISDISVTSKTHQKVYGLAMDAIKNGPLWIPATQNGRKVICMHKIVLPAGL